jgi:DNA-binding phage protein
MPLKTTPFDPVDYLTTPQALAVYLLAGCDGEPADQADALAIVARARARIAANWRLIPNVPGSLK